MANLNATTMADSIKTMYEKRLLIRAFPRLIHSKWGKPATLSGNGSYEVRRYESMPLVTSTLSEGNTPVEEDQPTITTLTVTPQWYGSWIGYTDQLEVSNFDPVVSEITGLLGEQCGLSIDTLVRNAITDGFTKDYANNQTARTDLDATNDLIDYGSFLDTLSLLMTANALPVEGEMYPVIMHPYSWATLMQDTTFVTLMTREGGENMRQGKVGYILNCVIYVTSNARSYTNGGAGSAVDVYDALFIGRDAYTLAGFTGLQPSYDAGSGAGEYDNNTDQSVSPVQVIVKELGETGLDPLNQRGTVGWKVTHEELILNSAFGISLEHATTQS